MVILNILIFILVLSLIVLIHEFGHFFFARRANVLCHEFSIGMGPVIYQKRQGEIVYSIRALPLGGYVAMAGEDMNEAYIKKGQTIGIRLNDNDITNIILDDNLNYDVIGVVDDFELYGKNNSELFITLKVDDQIVKYNVLRDAKYRFKGDKPMWITPAERSFETKTLWERFLIIFAGPMANFILAFILLFMVGIFMGAPNKKAIIGKAQPGLVVSQGDEITHVNGKSINDFQSLQDEITGAMDNKVQITIDNKEEILDLQVYMQGLGLVSTYKEDELIISSSSGRGSSLQSKDKIVGIYMSNIENDSNIVYTDVSTWNELISYASNSENSNKQHIYVQYLRPLEDGLSYDITDVKTDSYVGISKNAANKLGSDVVAYSAGFEQARKFSLLFPFTYPFKQIGSDVKQMGATLGLLFNPNEKVGVGDLSGPVGIYSLVTQSFQQGFTKFVIFVAFLSVNIGLINLLPIPALDGGRLVFLGYEAITKKPVNKRIENLIINVTFIMLLALIIFVTFNDILRLFN